MWPVPSLNSQKSNDFPRHFLLLSQVLFVSMIAKQSIDSNVIFLTLRTSVWVLSVDSAELQAFWILFLIFLLNFLMCFTCVCVPHMCLVPPEARKRVPDPPGTGVTVLLEMEPGPVDNKIAQNGAQSQHVGVLPAVSCDKQWSLLRYFIAEGS